MRHSQGFWNRVLHLFQPSKQSTRYEILWLLILHFMRSTRSTLMSEQARERPFSHTNTKQHTHITVSLLWLCLRFSHVLRIAAAAVAAPHTNEQASIWWKTKEWTNTNAPAYWELKVCFVAWIRETHSARVNCTPPMCIQNAYVFAAHRLRCWCYCLLLFTVFLARRSSFARTRHIPFYQYTFSIWTEDAFIAFSSSRSRKTATKICKVHRTLRTLLIHFDWNAIDWLV